METSLFNPTKHRNLPLAFLAESITTCAPASMKQPEENWQLICVGT